MNAHDTKLKFIIPKARATGTTTSTSNTSDTPVTSSSPQHIKTIVEMDGNLSLLSFQKTPFNLLQV